MVHEIVSGGQTGVDRAGLDAALELGLPCGGWCPRGRKSEDGTIPPRYPLTETPSAEYAQRTEWNVRDSDGTLVLVRGKPSQGTAFTIEVAERLGRPCLIVELHQPPNKEVFRSWITTHDIRILNVAGPREEKNPGIYQESFRFLHKFLAATRE